MKHILKFMHGELIIRIGLWGMFIFGFMIILLNGMTPIGLLATVGLLLMAIDYPKKEKRNKRC